ncbi:MAG: hypothetical protein ABIK65_09560 [Candidatus Eisenbacteria bacterium]
MWEPRSTSFDTGGRPANPRRSPWLGRFGAWLLLALLPLVGLPAAMESAGDEGVSGPDDLISGRRYYLRLDVVDGSAALMLQGATLDEYRVDHIEIGSPRRAFRSRTAAGPWGLRVWTGGRLHPERRLKRIEVEAPESPGAGEETPPLMPIPPTAEELIPVPATFRIRYPGGLTVVVRAIPTPDSSGARAAEPWRTRVADRFDEAVRALRGDTVRLRITLPEEDALRLYRSLPEETALLIFGLS